MDRFVLCWRIDMIPKTKSIPMSFIVVKFIGYSKIGP